MTSSENDWCQIKCSYNDYYAVYCNVYCINIIRLFSAQAQGIAFIHFLAPAIVVENKWIIWYILD